MGSGKLVAEIQDMVNGLHSAIIKEDWRNLPRQAFTRELESAHSKLAGIKKHLDTIQEKLDKSVGVNVPSAKDLVLEYEKILAILEKNIEMEKAKKSRAKIVNLLEKEETPEVYAALEQRVLALLLKTRYVAERLAIYFGREESGIIAEKSTSKNVLDLLQRKEDELQELKEKYESIRKRSYLGYVEEHTVSDMEQELQESEGALRAQLFEMEKAEQNMGRQLELMQNSYAEIRQAIGRMREGFEGFMQKHQEFAKALKKERDYARRVVVDVEHETLQLRSAYTQEMLNLNESKLKARQEAEKEFGAEIHHLKQELQRREEILQHFRKLAESGAEKEKKLEEKVKELTLLLRTKEKHEAVKKHFLERTRRRKSSKE